MKKKLLICVNVDWFFISHRLCIAEAALKNNWRVCVLAEDTGRSQEITALGIQFINLPMSRSGTNPLNELSTLYNFWKIYKKIKPDVVHQVTLKPVIYGSLIARLINVKGVVNAISGLGYNFTGDRKSLIVHFMFVLMKIGFKNKNLQFIFQNTEDPKELEELGVLNIYNKLNIIKGSGVDLDVFYYAPPSQDSIVKILFPSRMLWDKGLKELQRASELLKQQYQDHIQFVLAGLADDNNRAGVDDVYLKAWSDGRYVNWIGYQRDMVSVYQNCDIVVLPSYREGMPRSLIEACAIGRPIVTTDAIGCKDCVDEGVNGFKVPVKSINELALALQKLIDNPELRIKMGKHSREKAVLEFDQREVVSEHLKIYKELLHV